MSFAQVSQTMSIGQTALRRWVEQYESELNGYTGIGKPLTQEQQRIRQLENENLQLRMDVVILKKSIGLLCPRAEMSYQLVDALQKEAIPVHQCCRVLEVSRFGFYAARRRLANPLFCKTNIHLRATFTANVHYLTLRTHHYSRTELALGCFRQFFVPVTGLLSSPTTCR